MNADNKRHVIIGVIALAVILLLLHFRRQVNNYINNNGAGITLGGVSLPGFNMAPRGAFPNIITNFGAPETTMIGACCADCSKPQSYMPGPSGSTYVFNAAQVPSNVFIYMPPPPPPPSGGGGGAGGGFLR